jgi:hypothetical protein
MAMGRYQSRTKGRLTPLTQERYAEREIAALVEEQGIGRCRAKKDKLADLDVSRDDRSYPIEAYGALFVAFQTMRGGTSMVGAATRSAIPEALATSTRFDSRAGVTACDSAPNFDPFRLPIVTPMTSRIA